MATMTTEMIAELTNEQAAKTTAIKWDGGEIVIKEKVGISELIEIAHSAADNCFDMNNEYFPEVQNLVVWAQIVRHYTDLELPADLDAQDALFNHTDLLAVVQEIVSSEQIGTIFDAVEKRIANMIDAGNNLLMNDMIEATAHINKLRDELAGVVQNIKTTVPMVAEILNADQKDEPAAVPKAEEKPAAKKPRRKTAKTEG